MLPNYIFNWNMNYYIICCLPPLWLLLCRSTVSLQLPRKNTFNYKHFIGFHVWSRLQILVDAVTSFFLSCSHCSFSANLFSPLGGAKSPTLDLFPNKTHKHCFSLCRWKVSQSSDGKSCGQQWCVVPLQRRHVERSPAKRVHKRTAVMSKLFPPSPLYLNKSLISSC